MTPLASSLAASTNWFLSVGSSLWYSLYVLQRYRNMCNKFYSTGPFLPVPLLSQFSLENSVISLPKCGGSQSCCSHIRPPVQDAQHLNTQIIHFSENFCNTELFNVHRWQMIQSGYCPIHADWIQLFKMAATGVHFRVPINTNFFCW